MRGGAVSALCKHPAARVNTPPPGIRSPPQSILANGPGAAQENPADAQNLRKDAKRQTGPFCRWMPPEGANSPPLFQSMSIFTNKIFVTDLVFIWYASHLLNVSVWSMAKTFHYRLFSCVRYRRLLIEKLGAFSKIWSLI